MFIIIFIAALAVLSLCIVEVHNHNGILSAEEYMTAWIVVFGITVCTVILGFIGYIYL